MASLEPIKSLSFQVYRGFYIKADAGRVYFYGIAAIGQVKGIKVPAIHYIEMVKGNGKPGQGAAGAGIRAGKIAVEVFAAGYTAEHCYTHQHKVFVEMLHV